MKNLKTLVMGIDNMADMNDLIKVVNARRKVLIKTRNAGLKATFNVGDTVNIDSKKGTLVGVITKINRSRALCDINGSSYYVPFSIMAVA